MDPSKLSNTHQQKDHLWVYNLKSLDKNYHDYTSQSLTIVRGNTRKYLKFNSWDDMKQLSSDEVIRSIDEVIFIPRSEHGQFYIVSGLQSSLHFSLGQIGKETFHNFLHCHGIRSTTSGLSLFDNLESSTSGLFVKTAIQNQKTRLENEYFKLMVKMGSYLWQPLFMVS